MKHSNSLREQRPIQLREDLVQGLHILLQMFRGLGLRVFVEGPFLGRSKEPFWAGLGCRILFFFLRALFLPATVRIPCRCRIYGLGFRTSKPFDSWRICRLPSGNRQQGCDGSVCCFEGPAQLQGPSTHLSKPCGLIYLEVHG